MPEPTRPGEIPHSVRLAELAAHVQRHTGALFDHRLGVAPLTDADRTGHALAELAYATALAERAQAGRWVYACEALGAGASHAQVADALGLDMEELHAGIRSWARTQLRQGLIDDGEPPATDPAEHLPTWRLRRLVTLIDALGDPPMSLAERASLVVLAGQEQATINNLTAVILRSRGAEL